MAHLYLFFLLIIGQPEIPDIQGHWIQITNDPKKCPEEILFKSNYEFSIIKECFEDKSISVVTSGEYETEDQYLFFKNLMFTSYAGDFLTQEYSRIEWKVQNDTLTLEVFRYTPETRTYLRE